MKRILHIADLHFDETKRFDECVRNHKWIADKVVELDVDLVTVGGDIFERKSTPAERNAVAEFILQVTEWCPMIMVRGNHDVPGDLAIFGKLRTKHELIIDEAAAAHLIAGFTVCTLSWPRKAELLARLPESVSPDQASQAAQVALRAVLRGFGNYHGGNYPKVLLAHAMVRGSVTSVGQPLVGLDMEVSLEDLGLAQCDAYLLGHIHKGQDWEIDRAPVIYPGSPRRTTFGEIEDKYAVVLSFEQQRLVDIEKIVIPCTPMLLLNGEFNSDLLEGESIIFGTDPMPSEIQGAEIRLRYKVSADLREGGKKAANSLADSFREMGAILVQVEEDIIPTTRVRASQMSEAVGLDEKLKTMWGFQGRMPDETETAELLSKLSALELEVHNAG